MSFMVAPLCISFNGTALDAISTLRINYDHHHGHQYSDVPLGIVKLYNKLDTYKTLQCFTLLAQYDNW